MIGMLTNSEGSRSGPAKSAESFARFERTDFCARRKRRWPESYDGNAALFSVEVGDREQNTVRPCSSARTMMNCPGCASVRRAARGLIDQPDASESSFQKYRAHINNRFSASIRPGGTAALLVSLVFDDRRRPHPADRACEVVHYDHHEIGYHAVFLLPGRSSVTLAVNELRLEIRCPGVAS